MSTKSAVPIMLLYLRYNDDILVLKLARFIRFLVFVLAHFKFNLRFELKA